MADGDTPHVPLPDGPIRGENGPGPAARAAAGARRRAKPQTTGAAQSD